MSDAGIILTNLLAYIFRCRFFSTIKSKGGLHNEIPNFIIDFVLFYYKLSHHKEKSEKIKSTQNYSKLNAFEF